MSRSPELSQLVRRGAGAVIAAQMFSQVVSLLALGCLTRLVDAASFGVIGLALPLVVLPRTAATLGFSTAAIQDAHGGDELLSALFWRGLAWSIVAAALTMLMGWFFGWLYETPQLGPVAAAMAIATIFSALGGVHLSVLERTLRLGTGALVRVVSQTVAAAGAVIAAWYGWGVWSLVVQYVCEWGLLAALAWIVSAWRPGWRHFRLSAEASRFGGYYAASSLCFFASQNIDKLLLAAWLGSSARGQALLGMYAQAYNVMLRPVYFVTSPISSVMLTTLSRVQQDTNQRQHWIERFYEITGLLLLPAGVGLWTMGREAMAIIAPDWPEAGDFLTILSPVILAQGFINIAGSVLTSVRRSDLLFLSAGLHLAFIGVSVWAGASFAGYDYLYTTPDESLPDTLRHQALGAAAGLTAATLAILLPYMAVVLWIAETPLISFFRSQRLALPAALTMGIVVYLARQAMAHQSVPEITRLAVCVALGVLVYGVIVLPPMWSQWKRSK